MGLASKALGLAMLVVSMTACSGGDSPEAVALPDGITTTAGGDTVLIGNEWRACAQDSDCVLVDVSCDGCCQQDAVATSVESDFGPARTDACADYEGGECDCCFVIREAACSDAGLCEAVTPDGEDPNACL